MMPTWPRLGWFVYFSLLLPLRLSPVWLLQPGYLHPDEFFQSVEVAAEDIFGVETFRAWEFRGDKPIRSLSAMFPFTHIPLIISRQLFGPLRYTDQKLPGGLL
ncbi:unnamed protein product [Protopolystoma xenopodis]|uniref:Uncharacterized protein n=1 Tax=Protopolystoma xenopodis TaxID=117903 RepID=A0A448XAC8_9PLAT|nr:unnamed protein product [Protopolystoma xenopodis]